VYNLFSVCILQNWEACNVVFLQVFGPVPQSGIDTHQSATSVLLFCYININVMHSSLWYPSSATACAQLYPKSVKTCAQHYPKSVKTCAQLYPKSVKTCTQHYLKKRNDVYSILSQECKNLYTTLPQGCKNVYTDQLYKPICDSDSDGYRGPDSSSEGEGGWEGQPGVSLQPDRIVTRHNRKISHLTNPQLTDKIEISRQCPLLEVPLIYIYIYIYI
jgi:hypothetical protein